MKHLHDCRAPAKLNLFLHVTGRRDDGYHLLQSVFQLIDLADVLHFDRRDDGAIVRVTEVPGVPADDDLIVRAARLLAEAAGADGITAHLREDRRHIRDADIEALAAALTVPLNFECAATAEMQAIALRYRPHAVCLVPEKRE